MFGQKGKDVRDRALDIEEIRLVADLRIMHAKTDELYQAVKSMRERHDEASIVAYAEPEALAGDIARVDEIYLWFVKIKEEADLQARKGS
jgi:hypothetical protein